jgi:hypothetical protein
MTRARSLSRLANTNAFTVDASNNVGIGSTQPDVRLDVNGDMNVTGTLTYEDVTNVETAGITTTGGLVVTGLGATIGGITTFFGDINFGAAGVGGTITTLGHAEFAGVVTASSYRGDGSQLTGVDSSNLIDSGDTNRVAANTSGIVVTGISTLITTTAADSSNAYNFVIRGDDNGTDDESAQIFLGAINATTRGTAIAAQRKSSSNNHDLIFKTSAAGAVPTERVRIDSSGLVGIGTDNPGDELDIQNNGGCFVNIKNNTNSGRLVLGSNTSANQITSRDSGNGARNLEIFTGTTTTAGINIDTSGRVMLGTSTEGEAGADELTVASSGDCGITIRSGSSNKGKILFSDSTSGDGEHDGYIQYEQNNRLLRFGTATAERVRITSAGRVGIATASPDSPLEVHLGNGSGNQNTLILTRQFSSNYCAITWKTESGGTTDWSLGQNASGDFEVFHEGADAQTAFTIQDSGSGAYHVLPGGDNAQDLGSTSLRWANIYSADLQLSNEGSSNDVDGTWGQYTIQEGENDLFLLNRRNGKTYKFVLEEVN